MITENQFEKLQAQMEVLHKAILDTDAIFLKIVGVKKTESVAINNMFLNYEKIQKQLSKLEPHQK